MQRVLGAKNLKEAQKGSLLTGLTCVFCPIFLVAPGVIQFIRDGGVLTDFDMAYPSLIKDILPTPYWASLQQSCSVRSCPPLTRY